MHGSNPRCGYSYSHQVSRMECWCITLYEAIFFKMRPGSRSRSGTSFQSRSSVLESICAYWNLCLSKPRPPKPRNVQTAEHLSTPWLRCRCSVTRGSQTSLVQPSCVKLWARKGWCVACGFHNPPLALMNLADQNGDLYL